MNQDTLVSVVMAVRNGQAFVAKAVDSIHAQTYQNWEMVIVDDGSTDGTLRILGEFAKAEPRIRVFPNRINMGLACSLNRGCMESRGELIARMDADDVSMPQRLEKQVEYMGNNPDIDILGTGAVLVDQEGNKIRTYLMPEKHDDIVRTMRTRPVFFHPTVMFRTRFFRQMGGYDVNFRRCEDLELWLRAKKIGRFANLQEPLLFYSARMNLKALFLKDTSIRYHLVHREYGHLEALRQTVLHVGYLIAVWLGLWRPRWLKKGQ